jgi:tetratricopeptide (TPR) repeat protein
LLTGEGKLTNLRVTQHPAANGGSIIEVALEGSGFVRQVATAPFSFELRPQDHEDIRWYLEEFFEAPTDPAPRIASRVETRIAELGSELFCAVFESSRDALRIWTTLRPELNDARVEIVCGVRESATVPWEIMADVTDNLPVALRAKAFVRTHPKAAQAPKVPYMPSRPVRILLVICRPGGADDVPFRSVASRLLRSLDKRASGHFELDLLRPPTFERLASVLRAAKDADRPYHVVHFDGHGGYPEREHAQGRWRRAVLAFESGSFSERTEPIDGTKLGNLMVETGVPVLVLNACRSAHAEPPGRPVPVDEAAAEDLADPHSQVRSFGSFAHEVMETGVAAVVAMRYNVYVVTAAQFVGDVYGALAQGQSIGQAVSLGRKQLHSQPNRQIGHRLLQLQDWLVPVVYEATPLPLFPTVGDEGRLTITVTPGTSMLRSELLGDEFLRSPEVGFFGRDETILALDRAFDRGSIVLLHAWAGSGKSTTAAEFAGWYTLTGGLDGPVLLTSFERYRPFAGLLNQIEQAFRSEIEQAGVNWLALAEDGRRDVALQVLAQRQVLWIWDNVESIAGFPSGADSPWTPSEQKELASFLREAAARSTKFLLTSRRDERAWLGDLPHRVTVPPMPMQERIQLADALAGKYGQALTQLEVWEPLLRFTQGNPLTITSLVGQAVRDGLRTREEIESFIDRVRAGEAAFEDELSEGRSRSLAASLNYGFKKAFSERERRLLALLHLFQGFVNVQVLGMMGHPLNVWCVEELAGLDPRAMGKVLDRAADVGLLTRSGVGFYGIHPAVPWFLKSVFDDYFSEAELHSRVRLSFLEAMGEVGNTLARQYDDGTRGVLAPLKAEEDNLLKALDWAREEGSWDIAVRLMHGLHRLYVNTGRDIEWARVLGEILPEFVDEWTDRPISGRERQWSSVTDYRVQLAQSVHDLANAERLQRMCVEWDRRNAAEALARMDDLSAEDEDALRTLAVALNRLGRIDSERGDESAIAPLTEALNLYKCLGLASAAAMVAIDIGNMYLHLGRAGDVDSASRWYAVAAKVCPEEDDFLLGTCFNKLGLVAHAQLVHAREAGEATDQLIEQATVALAWQEKALESIPSQAAASVGVVHTAIANTHYEIGQYSPALAHSRSAIEAFETANAKYEAALARFNAGLALKASGRLADAHDYLAEALRNFKSFGSIGVEHVESIESVIQTIEEELDSGA